MKPKQLKRLQQMIVLCTLAAAAGGVLGYWLGYRAGYIAGSPNILMGVQISPSNETT